MTDPAYPPLPMDRRTMMIGAAAFGLMPLPPVTAPALAAPAAAAPAAAAPFVSRRIAVTVRGKGPDVLLIPGLASGAGVWNGAVAAVPGYRYHLVQVRGFAGLAPDLNRTGPLIDPLVQELARYIAASGLRDPAVVGHSMGGTLAMMLALRGAARRVMVVDMLPQGAGIIGGSGSGIGYLADQLSGYFLGTPGGRRMFADMLARNPGAQGSDPDVIAIALRELAHVDLTPRLPRISNMTVVYAQSADPQLRQDQVRRFRTGYATAPGARLVPIGPSGHMVMADQPARFAAALRDFQSR